LREARVICTIGIARATLKIGMANIVYNPAGIARSVEAADLPRKGSDRIAGSADATGRRPRSVVFPSIKSGLHEVAGEMLVSKSARGELIEPSSFFPASNPRIPPLSVVFTLWESITPAVGEASRPACSRAAITSAWLIDGQTPASRHL